MYSAVDDIFKSYSRFSNNSVIWAFAMSITIKSILIFNTLFFSLFLFVLAPIFYINVCVAQTISSVQRLEEGIEGYENGKYDDAIFKLEMAVYQIPVDDKENLWNAHFYLGLLYHITGDNDEAGKQFIKAQGQTKNKSPDILIHSPKVVKLFNETLKSRQVGVWKDPITDMVFVFVKGGCYEMGDTFGDGDGDEKPVHKVCIDDFYLGKYEVTNAEFEKFISETGYVTTAEKEGTGWGISGSGKTDWGNKKGINWKHPLWQTDTIKNKIRYPVLQVSWYDTQEYIRWLNQKTGESYRLPTEAEWEYAARSGGKSQKYSWGNMNPSGNIADEPCKRVYQDWTVWEGYDDGYVYTAPVGSYKPNGLVLYDMTGNVWEWCQDWYGDNYYRSSPVNNPKGPSSGSGRVIRGGSWFNYPRSVRASDRYFNLPPDIRYCFLGFRLARTP
jgi:formylglycine-generating enzyme